MQVACTPPRGCAGSLGRTEGAARRRPAVAHGSGNASLQAHGSLLLGPRAHGVTAGVSGLVATVTQKTLTVARGSQLLTCAVKCLTARLRPWECAPTW